MSKNLNTTTTPEAATPMNHGTVTIQFNGLTVPVGFDIHADQSVDYKEEFVRMAALRCVSDFFDAYRVGKPKILDGEGEDA